MSIEFKLRPMLETDLDITFSWRNDPQVLKYAQTSNPISYNEHEAVFKFNNSLKLIFEVNSAPVGYVSCSRDSAGISGEWSFHIGKEHRGQGLSEIMLRAALYYLIKEEGYFHITATVLEHNEISHILHDKLGFIQNGPESNGFIKYIYDR